MAPASPTPIIVVDPDRERAAGILSRLAELGHSARSVDSFVDDGLVVVSPEGYSITPMGRLVVRNIAMCFDRYLDDLRGDKPIFSRTV